MSDTLTLSGEPPAEDTRGWYARNRHLYPPDWDAIAWEVKTAAGWRCEACDNPHGPPPYILTVDHVVDHNPANVARDNLAALCQRCHMRRANMIPAPQTKAEALRRLSRRYAEEQQQGRLEI